MLQIIIQTLISSRTNELSISLSSYSPSVCCAPRTAQPHLGLPFPPDSGSLRRRGRSGLSSWIFSFSEESGELGSAQGCDLHISICGQPQCALCHAHCGHAVLSPCAFLDVCHLAHPTPMCSTLQRGWRICLPPSTQTHTLSRAGCVPCSSQLSAAHPLCTSQPGCITSLACNNN